MRLQALVTLFLEKATMKKLILHLDDLKVDTFEVSRTAPARGTVRANDYTYAGEYTCYGVETCAQDTCGYTCGATDPETSMCPPSQGWRCSFESPHYTMCDFSCEFACPPN
jgi:hypothetical protein